MCRLHVAHGATTLSSTYFFNTTKMHFATKNWQNTASNTFLKKFLAFLNFLLKLNLRNLIFSASLWSSWMSFLKPEVWEYLFLILILKQFFFYLKQKNFNVWNVWNQKKVYMCAKTYSGKCWFCFICFLSLWELYCLSFPNLSFLTGWKVDFHTETSIGRRVWKPLFLGPSCETLFGRERP